MKTIPTIYLASSSSRRISLLHQMGFSFRILPNTIDESNIKTLDPFETVNLLSRMKAESVLNGIQEGIVIGADTLVFLNGEILGKPRNDREATQMLQKLSGKTHEVYTGFTLIQIGGKCISDVEITSVIFRKLTVWEIQDYVKSGGPLDKAGGYGIQDRSGLFVDRISGCFYNVVGFPLTKFYQSLKSLLGENRLREMIWQGKETHDERTR